jgi:hypothetical protein
LRCSRRALLAPPLSHRIPLPAVRCTRCSRTRSHTSHTPTRKHARTCTHARVRMHLHACSQAYARTHARLRKHARTDARTLTQACTHGRTHLRAVAQLSSFLRFRSSSQRFRVHCAVVRQVQASPRDRCSRPLLAHAMLLRHPPIRPLRSVGDSAPSATPLRRRRAPLRLR